MSFEDDEQVPDRLADESKIPAFTDADSIATMKRALRLLLLMATVATAVVWWKMGWRSAALLAIGAVISGSGLYEWMRLMGALMARMDGGGSARPMGWLLAGFFLRLGLTFVVVYGSLRLLDGSVYALLAGLALGVLALSVEGLRLIKAWTV